MRWFLHGHPLSGSAVGRPRLASGVSPSALRANLVPKSFHDQIVDDRDHWRGIAEELQKENTKLLITGELGVSSIMAIEQRMRDAEQRGRDKEAQL